jgi:hypothetical protein
MRLVTYDCEVFAYNWIVVLKDYETKHFTVIHNDNDALAACINDDTVYCGFNSKGYDQYIIKAICAGFPPEEVKKVNDYIIAGGQGWECPSLQGIWFKFNNIDIKDDMQMGLSLKAIEGHLGMNICESEVDFTLDRPLTQEELESTIFYCKHDVDATEQIITLRKNYLQNKINIGKLAGLDEIKAMSMTNAKLTAALLKARLVKHDDERSYEYPGNLRSEYIPQEVFDFFDRMKDDTLSDKDVFTGKLNISIGECPVTIGYGGIHGAIPNFMWEEGKGRIIRNYDVASYYPHLMTIYGYTSRNIPSPGVFSEVLESRMKAKAAGDTATANALKLVVNTTYGASLNKYNDLCDPLMGRSVCISGQLFLLEMAQRLHSEVENLRIVQLNTDGIMIEFDDRQYDHVQDIINEWQARTGFELEEDSIARLAQKDVNGYVEVQPSGKFKSKGGYLVRGVITNANIDFTQMGLPPWRNLNGGAFNINNNATIVSDALVEYFVHGTPPEDTINACDDIFQFQMIAKAGAKYREAYHMVDGEKIPVQKVNRIYATADLRYGKLFKVKAENDSEAKIEMLPEHCIIDNDNHLTIADVDKQFYIDMAKKRINDFMGIKPEKKGRKTKMANAIPKNVYQKLLEARVLFMEEDVKKSGKNMKMSYKYFELQDIVPVATPIFQKVGLLPVVTFDNDVASMTIFNVDNPGEFIVFTSPMREIEPIISTKTGGEVTNAIQRLGSVETYQRRYLYMAALDIVESDDIEPQTGNNPPPAPKPSAPVTAEKREEVAKTLTASEGNATELQIKGLKTVLARLREADPSKEDMITQIAMQTNGFTTISKNDCEELIKRITCMLGEGAK